MGERIGNEGFGGRERVGEGRGGGGGLGRSREMACRTFMYVFILCALHWHINRA